MWIVEQTYFPSASFAKFKFVPFFKTIFQTIFKKKNRKTFNRKFDKNKEDTQIFCGALI